MTYRIKRADGLYLAYRGRLEWTIHPELALTWTRYDDAETALRWIQHFSPLPLEVEPEDNGTPGDIDNEH